MFLILHARAVDASSRTLSMALPTLTTHTTNRSRVLAAQMARQREQEARWRQQWDRHAQYLREQSVRSQKQEVWSSRQSYQQSMSKYHKQKQAGERKARLEQRRDRLRTMLQEEQNQYEAELRALRPDSSRVAAHMVQRTEELRSAREQRKIKLAQELLKEHWRENTPQLRDLESALHQDHVVSQWQSQISEKKLKEAVELEEKKRFESEYEQSRKEALERIEEAEEKRKAEERQRAEELRKQMEELKLREEEATRLKKEQQTLLMKQWELDNLEGERRKVEEKKKKTEIGHFLIRQYRAQLKRRAQQVQEELEADRKILAALMEGEHEDRRLEAVRKERAVADAAWMKHVIEEQLQLEREREAEFDILHREAALNMWERREAQWEKERLARERLMHEVLVGRQQQLELKMKKNREAQEESLKRREKLIQELEQERMIQRQDKEQGESRRTARLQEIQTQVEQQHQEQGEQQHRIEQKEEEHRKELELQEEELQLEMQRMANTGYQGKINRRPRSAWI